jgi:hypothetical protein
MNNNSLSEGVLVKNEATGEVLTIDMMIKTVRSEVGRLYPTYPYVKQYFELDDIVQDIICYYFSPMKKVNKTRLLHYSELYDCNIKYLTNLFKLTSRQWLNMLCRNMDVKNNPVSLNTVVSMHEKFDSSMAELQDFIKDDSLKDILDEQDLFNDILTSLHDYNFYTLYSKLKKLHKNNYSVSRFYMDPMNLIKVQEATSRQESLLRDILKGFSKAELKSKYKDFNKIWKVLKFVLELRMEIE